MSGAWSASPGEPLRVDAAAFTEIDAATLAQWFQVTPRNPLVGLEGRAALLRRLGDMLETRPDRFGLTARPSALFDRMTSGPTISASAILRAVLDGFGGIWRAPLPTDDDNEMPGDVWRHPQARRQPVLRAATCRSTSCRNGSRIRCSNRSSGQVSR